MSSIKQPVIISAVRTPVGKFLGALKDFKATQLGAIVVREAVRRAGVKPEDVDEWDRPISAGRRQRWTRDASRARVRLRGSETLGSAGRGWHADRHVG